MNITKEDFHESHALSRQIEPQKITGAINDALLLDVRPCFVAHSLLLESLLILPEFTAQEWPVVLEDIVAGEYVIRLERVFKALPLEEADRSEVPTEASTSDSWQYLPLHTLWLLYLKSYWKQAAFCRFLPTHGYNLEKAGFTMPADPQGTYQPAGASHRAALQASAENTAAALLNRLLRYLRTAHPSTEEHSCGAPSHRRRRVIRGV